MSNQSVFVVPSFHYDVAYLKPYAGYLPDCFYILDEAIRIAMAHEGYRFLIEQVILLEEYWERFPAQRAALKQLAQEGRIEVAPGMYVMPDMNHPDGESLFMQAKVGFDWLREHLGVQPRVCWIADCWGHPAQSPQILRQCGYDYYVFWRCMRRDVLRNTFVWRGLDGTTISSHWLARGYANLRFPTAMDAVNALELTFVGCRPEDVNRTLDDLGAYGREPVVLLCNGGDMAHPQAAAPETLRRLNDSGQVPPMRFGTPSECLDAIDWSEKTAVAGEFNAALQGTFTSNIFIKQENRRLTNRLLAVESLAAVLGKPVDLRRAWKLVLKQQFHDIICGTITDEALRDCAREFTEADAAISSVATGLDTESEPVVFNPLSWPRAEIIEHAGRRVKVTVPALGFASLADAPLPAAMKVDEALPQTFETEWYRATIDASGYVASLIDRASGRELVKGGAFAFGGLTLQMDYGDLWLNFRGPLDGGSLQSSLTQNDPDPLDRKVPGEIVITQTFRAQIERATVVSSSIDELVIEQHGRMNFWRLGVRFTTRVRLNTTTPRIEYETVLQPSGRHYRIRAAFPSSIVDGVRRDEIAMGIETGRVGEHVVQNWASWTDGRGGLAILNNGTPAANVCDGVLMATLFRSVAMEYKTESAMSFAEGVEQRMRYAIMPVAAGDDVSVVRNGWEFNRPLMIGNFPSSMIDGWNVEPAEVIVSALRPHANGTFLRFYESVGRDAQVRLRVPGRFKSYVVTDGLERPSGEPTPVGDGIELTLRPFEIRGLLLS